MNTVSQISDLRRVSYVLSPQLSNHVLRVQCHKSTNIVFPFTLSSFPLALVHKYHTRIIYFCSCYQVVCSPINTKQYLKMGSATYVTCSYAIKCVSISTPIAVRDGVIVPLRTVSTLVRINNQHTNLVQYCIIYHIWNMQHGTLKAH